VGDRITRTDQTLEGGGTKAEETRSLHQPSVETVLTSGPITWTQTFEVQDTRTSSNVSPDVDRLRTWILEQVEWAPQAWPRLTARLDRRTDEDDLFTDREEIYTLLQLDDARGPFDWLYAFETQTLRDNNVDGERFGAENRLRAGWRDELVDGALYSSVILNSRVRQDTNEFDQPGTGVPPGEVFPTQGLALVDTTPNFAVLASNPALIDGDELTPVGINIGGFVSGGQTYWNIGVGIGLNATIDKILLTTEEEVDPFLVEQFSFSVWTSNDNDSWTLVQGTVPYVYDDVNRRFRLSFTPVTGLYLKVVNEVSPPGAPAVQVTEMRIFGPDGAGGGGSTTESNLYEHNVRANFNYRGVDNVSLTWDIFGQLAGNEYNGDTTRDEHRLDNSLNALWAPADRVDVSLRAENRNIQDKIRPDELVTVLGGTVEYRPLDTLDVGASYTWSDREFALTGDYTSEAAQLRSTARLLDDLEAEISLEHIVQDDQGLQIETTRDILTLGLVARVTPRFDLTLRWSDTDAALAGPGADESLDPSSQTWELLGLWRMTDLLTGEVRLLYRDAQFGEGLDENYRLSWLPLPDGSVDIQLDVLRRVDGLQELSTDTYSVLVQWLINKRTWLNFTYGAQIPEEADRTDLFTVVLNVRF
jgi:hypothetical protein